MERSNGLWRSHVIDLGFLRCFLLDAPVQIDAIIYMPADLHVVATYGGWPPWTWRHLTVLAASCYRSGIFSIFLARCTCTNRCISSTYPMTYMLLHLMGTGIPGYGKFLGFLAFS